MEKIPIIFSTVTGNAFRLADAAARAIPEHIGPYNIRWLRPDVTEEHEVLLLSYWCNRGTADDDTIELLRSVRDKKIIIIGTLGARRDSAHAQKVCENVENLVREQNTLIGHYLCRGSIDLERTARKLRIPEGEKGHLSQERFELQKESQGHPDEEDIRGLREALAEFMLKL